MALFQKSVLKKFLNQQDKEAVAKAYKKFSKHFHDPRIQANIREAKEEQYQEGFLRELFVDVFGYTLNPKPNFNLTTELKNIKDSKKTDGAILKDGEALAVIELKSTKTKDLSTIEAQAFGYKSNHPKCVYVITSNFEKVNFYINNTLDPEEFDLFNMTEERFAVLYLCLNSENILSNLPLRIKEASIVEEESITKKFYADYSLFKRELYRDLVKKNLRNEVFRGQLIAEDTAKADKNIKLTLFKKSQKLIDRFLFIFFSEDRGLLPPNSTHKILDDWNKLKELDAVVPLYDRFKLYFSYLDTGRKGTDQKAEIFAYNGGLFKPDGTLDSLLIDDELLHKHTRILAHYDFDSQVDVNILGHIFENSLNEIESVNAEIEGVEFDKQKTKRKKDGVFYTPKYITKYIVDNTVGKLCEEKKAELGIVDEEYTSNRQKDTKRKLLDKLDQYRNWLLELTICDPACGSGAFLNQALDFLINEHRAIDELQASLLGGAIVFQEIENTILEKNIYGVDLNEESVEIAKLSLWLRTAQPRRKLNDLNNNIKCGNSLIDSKAVAGDKAFNWEKEFPEVFAKGGFDVVIGNPPWGAKLGSDVESVLLKKYPEVPSKLKDSYMYFMLLCIDILKQESYYGLIVPNTWLLINNTAQFRKTLLGYKITEITDHGDGVFQDAIVESATLFLKKEKSEEGIVKARKYQKGKLRIEHLLDKKYWLNDELNRIVIEFTEFDFKLIKKMESISKRFDSTSEIIFGIKPYQVGHGKPPQTREIVSSRIYHSEEREDNSWKPLVTGTDVNRYSCVFNNDAYIKYGEWLMYSSNEDKILSPKILLRRTSADLRAVVDIEQFYPQNSLFIITSTHNLYYLCGLLNSKLFDHIYKSKCPQVGKVFAEVKPSIIKSLPIAKTTEVTEKKFEIVVTSLQSQHRELEIARKKFENYTQSSHNQLILSKKLKFWYDLDFSDFIKELNKVIKKVNGEKLSKADEMEWMDLFESKKKEAMELKTQIDKTDKEIDQMVYKLYGLTEEEIKIVEEA